MKIGLVSYRCRDKDVPFNLAQIERAMQEAQGKVDLLCFGEAYLQGFDSLVWDYAIDQDMAVELDAAPIQQLCRWTEQYGMALLTGYIQRDGDKLYSSCAVMENGAVLHNYRRISRGWKVYWKTDEHYQEGSTVEPFDFHGTRITLALCGDLWDYPERFRTDSLLIWPVSVSFSPEEWAQKEWDAYARQAALAAEHVLMINPIDDAPTHGGSAYFRGGKVVSHLPCDQEDTLIADVHPQPPGSLR